MIVDQYHFKSLLTCIASVSVISIFKAYNSTEQGHLNDAGNGNGDGPEDERKKEQSLICSENVDS